MRVLPTLSGRREAMARPERSGGLQAPNATLVIIAACGALAAVGIGMVVGARLRVPPRLDAETRSVVVPTQEVFTDSAPAYPARAPEPLYPDAERDPMTDFANAWDDAMAEPPRDSRPVALGAPADLPPPYEVRMENEARPVAETPRRPHPARPANDGRYSYQGYETPSATTPSQVDRSRD